MVFFVLLLLLILFQYYRNKKAAGDVYTVGLDASGGCDWLVVDLLCDGCVILVCWCECYFEALGTDCIDDTTHLLL